jgi:hypothetical protein
LDEIQNQSIWRRGTFFILDAMMSLHYFLLVMGPGIENLKIFLLSLLVGLPHFVESLHHYFLLVYTGNWRTDCPNESCNRCQTRSRPRSGDDQVRRLFVLPDESNVFSKSYGIWSRASSQESHFQASLRHLQGVTGLCLSVWI